MQSFSPISRNRGKPTDLTKSETDFFWYTPGNFNDWLLNADLNSDSNYIYVTFDTIFKQNMYFRIEIHESFLCVVVTKHLKTGKLAIAENRGILKICSRKINFWFAENEIYRRRKPTFGYIYHMV